MYKRQGQKAADTVAGLRCLCGKIIIEAAEHGEFGDLLVSQFQRCLLYTSRTSISAPG